MTALAALRAITHDVTDLADRLRAHSVAIDTAPTADLRNLDAETLAWLHEMRAGLEALEVWARVVNRQCATIERRQ